jgi:hypothetical protein
MSNGFHARAGLTLAITVIWCIATGASGCMCGGKVEQSERSRSVRVRAYSLLRPWCCGVPVVALTIPRANAVATASVRERTPSFSRIALT